MVRVRLAVWGTELTGLRLERKKVSATRYSNMSRIMREREGKNERDSRMEEKQDSPGV